MTICVHPGFQPGLMALEAFPSKSLKQLIDLVFRLHSLKKVAYETAEGYVLQGVAL
jgi:hypothetical protein